MDDKDKIKTTYDKNAVTMGNEETQGISFFEKYLTVWVLLCMAA